MLNVSQRENSPAYTRRWLRDTNRGKSCEKEGKKGKKKRVGKIATAGVKRAVES